MRMRIQVFALLAALFISTEGCSQSTNPVITFTNPLFSSGADPWIIYKDSVYYYTSTSGSNLFISKGRNLDDLKKSERKVIWMPPAGTSYSKQIWAPELHFLNGNWYMYFAADDGKNENHRMYVVENKSPDPLSGTWEFKGKVADRTDKWAIDGSVFEYGGRLWFIWSGWEGDVNGQQNIYLAAMENPWTISGDRVLISKPEYPWETFGDLNNPDDVPHVNVNEGPVALQKDGRLFIVYSASGCWTDNYCLGMLTLSGSDPADASSWKKGELPVFTGDKEAGVFAPGHNSFFRSPDGSEDWILYHANPQAGQGCGRYRSPRAQKFSWTREGRPDFGRPVAVSKDLRVPSSPAGSK